jgi:hypothetical protein
MTMPLVGNAQVITPGKAENARDLDGPILPVSR